MFHEFVHAIHYVAGGERDNTMATPDQIYGNDPDKYLWTYWFFEIPPATPEEQKFVHEEEFYAIHGTFWSDGRFQYNPINCGLLEANRQRKAGVPIEKIVQRIFHMECGLKYEKFSIQHIGDITVDFRKRLVDENTYVV